MICQKKANDGYQFKQVIYAGYAYAVQVHYEGRAPVNAGDFPEAPFIQPTKDIQIQNSQLKAYDISFYFNRPSIENISPSEVVTVVV